MDAVIYVRRDAVSAHAPADLAAEGGTVRVDAETPVALRAGGPFLPLAEGLLASGALRDELATGVPTPSLGAARRVRTVVLATAAAPLAMLLELDRELLSRVGLTTHFGLGHVLVDLVLVAVVVYELTRKTPRLPAAAAIALFAVALRWVVLATRLCGGPKPAHPLIYVAAVICLGGGIAVLARVPAPARVTLELLGKVGVSRSAFYSAVTKPEPSGALVAAAAATAAALPAVVHLAQLAGGGPLGQAAAALSVALVGPPLARRIAPRDVPASKPSADLERVRVLLGLVCGLALAAGLVTVARSFFDSGAELARCFGRLDTEAKMARAAEAKELVRAAANVRSSTLLVVLTSTIFPFAEERVFRGLLQDVLVLRFGRAYGIFAAAVAFGVAHYGVYHVALYQTVLLGIGFGFAYAEGGLLAAIAAHAVWNLFQLA